MIELSKDETIIALCELAKDWRKNPSSKDSFSDGVRYRELRERLLSFGIKSEIRAVDGGDNYQLDMESVEGDLEDLSDEVIEYIAEEYMSEYGGDRS